jgi:isoquinoline 1-oxidoreductase beta subunit
LLGRRAPRNDPESFNSYVAQVAEVTMLKDGGFKVDRVVCAVDCGVP